MAGARRAVKDFLTGELHGVVSVTAGADVVRHSREGGLDVGGRTVVRDGGNVLGAAGVGLAPVVGSRHFCLLSLLCFARFAGGQVCRV